MSFDHVLTALDERHIRSSRHGFATTAGNSSTTSKAVSIDMADDADAAERAAKAARAKERVSG
jgi:hypothetical protein